MSDHIANNYFDAIIFNGIFYHDEVNKKDEIEKAVQECYQTLKSSGIFVVGWNDTEELIPFPLAEINYLYQFKPYIFPPLGTDRYLTRSNNKHTYGFYMKE